MTNHTNFSPIFNQCEKEKKKFLSKLLRKNNDPNPLIFVPYANESYGKLSKNELAICSLVQRKNKCSPEDCPYVEMASDGLNYYRLTYEYIGNELNLTIAQVKYACQNLQKRALLLHRSFRTHPGDKAAWFALNVPLFKKTIAIIKNCEAKNAKTRAANAKSKMQYKRVPNIHLKVLNKIYACQQCNRYKHEGKSFARMSYRKLAEEIGVCESTIKYWMDKAIENAEELGLTVLKGNNDRKRKGADRTYWFRLDGDWKAACKKRFPYKAKPKAKSESKVEKHEKSDQKTLCPGENARSENSPALKESLIPKGISIYTNTGVQDLLLRLEKKGVAMNFQLEHGIEYLALLTPEQQANIKNPIGFIISAGRNMYTSASYGSQQLTQLTELRKFKNKHMGSKLKSEERDLIKYKCPYTTKPAKKSKKSETQEIMPTAKEIAKKQMQKDMLFHESMGLLDSFKAKQAKDLAIVKDYLQTDNFPADMTTHELRHLVRVYREEAELIISADAVASAAVEATSSPSAEEKPQPARYNLSSRGSLSGSLFDASPGFFSRETEPPARFSGSVSV